MGILDLLRPKHRHSNADIRAEAVRQLGPDEIDLIIERARQDDDSSVRRIALEKIDDPELLVDLARAESDGALRDLARSRASGVWVTRAATASDLAAGKHAIAALRKLGDQRAIAEVAGRAELIEVRDAALEALDDDKALAELARNPATHMAARTTALARIGDQEVLRSIAVDEKRKDVALAALERIEDDALLDAVAGKAKHKAVRARARKKLSERQGTDSADTTSPEDKRRHAERVQLVRDAEALAQAVELAGTAERMAEIRRDWAAVGAGDDSDLARRFELAGQRHDKRYQAWDRARAEESKRKAEAEAARKAAAQAAQAAQKATPEATPEASPDASPEASADAAAETSADAAAQASTDAVADAQAEAPSERDAAAQAAAEQADADAAAARAEEAARKEERERTLRERRERDAQALAELTAELEAMIAEPRRRAAERLLQKADKSVDSLKLPEGSAAALARLHELRQALFIKVQELRDAEDWQRWANVPRQEALIEKAKALLTDPDDTRLVERLKDLQNEWKQVGPVPQKKSQELWTLFKGTCDQVYERVKGQRAKQNEEYAQNLSLKLALCERVESLAESTDWAQTAEEIKRLQREWKTIGPVPRKKSDAVWKRFRAACDLFFERRKPYLDDLMAERAKNLEAKQALCARAEELAESTDWQETASALRQLQRDWRDVGPVPRKESNEINKRFRAACDRFFERRQQHQDEERAERQRKLDQLRADVETLGGKSAGGSGGEMGPEMIARALEIRSELREIDLPDGAKQAMYESANALYRKVLEASPDAFAGTELDPAASRQKKHKLLARAEQVAPPPQSPAPAGKSPDDIVQRLRAALAENALSSSLARSTDGRSIADTITELRRSWLQVGPVPGAEGDDMEARFEAACERALRAAGHDA